jgi:hypothetical protein
MSLAKFAKLHGREQIEKLPLKVAHYIAARSIPASVAAEVLGLVAAGQAPTGAAIKGLIRERRQVENPPGGGQEPDEIEALSGLLWEGMAAHRCCPLCRLPDRRVAAGRPRTRP